MSVKIGILSLFFITAIVSNMGSTSIAVERVQTLQSKGEVNEKVCFENNQLFVDGEPFFFFGIDGVPDSFKSLRAHHFNTIFFWGRPSDKKKVQEAATAGWMVIPYIPARSWSLQHEQLVKEVEPKSAILAWNIGDDLKDKDVEKVRAAYEKIHEIAPNRPTMLDTKSTKTYQWFDELYCAYSYPLLKRRTLLYYQKYLMKKHSAVGSDKFFWTWVQSHVQKWYVDKYLNPTRKWAPSRYPDAEHIRLLTYCALAAGSKGIIYFNRRYYREDFYGTDRYSEAGILGCELEVLGPWLAQGHTGKKLESPMPNVDITPIDFPGGRLLLMMRLNDDYHYHVDAGNVEAFDLQLPHELKGGEAVYQIGFPTGVQKCDVEGNVIHMPAFELTQVLLITAKAELIQKAQKQFAQLLPEVATFAVTLSKAKLKKTMEVRDKLKELKVPEQLLPFENDLTKASELLNEAEKALQDGKHANAYSTSRNAQRIIRASVYASWSSMRNDKTLQGGSLQDYYLMPFFYEKVLATD